MRILLAAAALIALAAPARADCEQPTPLRPAAGMTSATITSGPETAAVDCYQIDGRAGQNMAIVVSGGGAGIGVAVYAPGWATRCDDGACDITGDMLGDGDSAEWSNDLGDSGAYLIVVDNSHGDAPYRLDVDMQ